MSITPRTEDLRDAGFHFGTTPPVERANGDALVTGRELWLDETGPVLRWWDGDNWVVPDVAAASVLAQATLAPSWSWAVAIEAAASVLSGVEAEATLSPAWSWAVAIEAAASVQETVDAQATLAPSWTWAAAIDAAAAVTLDIEAEATLAPAWSWAAAIDAAAEVLSDVDAQATLAPAWSWSVATEAEAEVGVSADADLAPSWSWAVAIEAAAGVADTAWSPADFGNDLGLWLDADALALGDGADVATWADEGPHGNDASEFFHAGDVSWSYRAAGPSVENTSIHAQMDVAHDATVDLTTVGAVYIVADLQDASGNQPAAGVVCKSPHGTSVTSQQYWMMRDGRCGLDSDQGDSGPTWPGKQIAGMVWDGADADIRIDGAVEDTFSSSGATSTSDKLTIGGRDRGGYCALGHYFEVVIVKKSLSSAEIDDLESYLADKWGITI